MRNDREQTDVKPMDPIALTLAVWLGLIAGVTELVRLSDRASSEAAARSAIQSDALRPFDDAQPIAADVMALGS